MSIKNPDSALLSRRSFVTGLSAASTLFAVNPSWALSFGEARKIAFSHTHTGEAMEIAYWAHGRYIKDGLAKVNYLLRDFRSGEQAAIDTGLLDQMAALQRAVGSKGRFEIISAYRSAATNSMLRGHSSGVAKKSFHMQGKAIDIRLTDVELGQVHKAALAMGKGGVGIYRGSNFIHLDTGPKRSWG